MIFICFSFTHSTGCFVSLRSKRTNNIIKPDNWMRSSWSLLLIKSVKIVRFKYCRPSPILLFCSLLFYFIILVRFNSCSCYNNNRSDFRYQLKSAVCNRLFIGCISTHSAHFHIKSTSAVFDFIYYNKGLGTWYSTIGFICGLKWQTKLEKWKMPNVR